MVINYTPNMNGVSISSAAEQLAISADTIRRWEKKGLIKSARDQYNHRIFSLEEITRVQLKTESAHGFQVLKNKQKSKFRTLELFAGAGGMALGLEHAGLESTMLVEFDKNPVQTLRANRPNWNVIHQDVRDVDFRKVKAEIVVGGFPCQAFSYAGQRLGFEDTRGTLFYEFARAIQEVQPKILVGENVRGLERHDEGRTLATMIDVLEQLGYNVAYRVLRAQYFDVPQKRERLIVLGVRKDLDLPILFPKEKNYTISVREALRDVPASASQQYPPKKRSILELIPEGGYWRDLPEALQREFMGASYHLGGGKTGMARRLAWDEPSLTLTCSPAQKQTERCHPSETRPLAIREYARIQSFPDDWQFTGSLASQYKQIGNAVPVNLGYHIGRCLIAMLEKKPDLSTMEHVKTEKPLELQARLF
jgi:DNA (cytosine-5)-methyltransferase 1